MPLREIRPFSLAAVLLLVAAIGCGSDVTVTPPPPAADVGMRSSDSSSRYLAYQHTVQVDTRESEIPRLFDSLQSVCHHDTADSCAVLRSQIFTAGSAGATLEFRVKHDGIDLVGSEAGEEKRG